VLALFGGVAAADPCCDDPVDPRAKDHLDRGRERHDAKEYELAIAEYGWADIARRLEAVYAGAVGTAARAKVAA